MHTDATTLSEVPHGGDWQMAALEWALEANLLGLILKRVEAACQDAELGGKYVAIEYIRAAMDVEGWGE